MLIKWANTRYTAGNQGNKWPTIWPHNFDKVVLYYNCISHKVDLSNEFRLLIKSALGYINMVWSVLVVGILFKFRAGLKVLVKYKSLAKAEMIKGVK